MSLSYLIKSSPRLNFWIKTIGGARRGDNRSIVPPRGQRYVPWNALNRLRISAARTEKVTALTARHAAAQVFPGTSRRTVRVLSNKQFFHRQRDLIS